MIEDDKNKEEAQASEIQEENIENNVDESEDESTKEESTEIDYSAELERLTQENAKKDEQLEKAGYAIQKAKGEAKEAPTFDNEAIALMIEEQVAARMGSVEKTALHTSAETVASQMSSGEDETKLIMHHYRHSIVPTGNLTEDIANAQALANRKRNSQVLSEAQRALASKGNAGTGGGSGQKAQASMQAPKLSPKDASLVAASKMKWNGKTSRYEGKYSAMGYNKATKGWESISLREE